MRDQSRNRVTTLLVVAGVAVLAGTACSGSDGDNSAESESSVTGSGILKGLAGKCLDAEGSVRLWECNGSAAQRWTVVGSEIRAADGRCLDVSGGSSTSGTAVILWPCHGGPNQRWTVGGHRVVGLAGKCLDVVKSNTQNGASIDLWDCRGTANQAWTFEPLARADAGVAADSGTGPADSGGGSSVDAGADAGSSTRDPLKQPFATDSIWNMPIGSGAVYVPANLSANPGNNIWAPMPGVDDEHIILKPTAPATTINYSSVAWSGGNRCAATGGFLFSAPMPTNYVVPNGNGNSSTVFLAADARTLIQAQPLARCTAGGPGTALVKFANVDLYGTGITGAHGGSGLSAIGGSIRVGELRPGSTGPRHALKVDVYAKEALFKCTTPAACFRWPALHGDSYAVGFYGTANNNSNTAMKQGSLLAIPAATDLSTLGLETEPAKQLAWTLQNYGAYIVDDTYAPGFFLNAEDGPDGSVSTQFKTDWGFDFEQKVQGNTAWVRDIQRLVRALHVVDNNGPTTIGGGGTPRQPLAPPINP